MSVVFVPFDKPARKAIAIKPETAEIKQFTHRLCRCSVCGSGKHRASQCPQRPRTTPVCED